MILNACTLPDPNGTDLYVILRRNTRTMPDIISEIINEASPRVGRTPEPGYTTNRRRTSPRLGHRMAVCPRGHVAPLLHAWGTVMVEERQSPRPGDIETRWRLLDAFCARSAPRYHLDEGGSA